ncbi:MAG: peptidyl-tRNA hydrolase Pth2 [Euryarchaeota archaeon]|nr:peptidyl-tRNA hydrolase Pth2 [Euryarchaeota archaeon]MDE1836101.1 peptidyl-tRNA hydrolase Pth2 [Euryarchaeota archaeon]MDE1879391.1 peptidyl-tRNA hydrolase Pth2 [Euryarchaeota archaeon]MDE2044079.1 peptidyl-tRNA hydrolase Pth2 [Thermoplasmata archaeon]
MVLVLRHELGLSAGKAAVQVAHAAVMLSLDEKVRRRREFRLWLEQGQKKVALKVETIAELEALRKKAEAMGIPTVVVEDAGLTEVPPGTRTVLGIGPGTAGQIDRVTGNLPLL